MADRLSEDLASLEFQRGFEQQFWQLESRNDHLVFVWLIAADERRFLAVLDCTSYGDEPILGRFIDPETRQCSSSAWPVGNAQFEQWIKFKGTPLFICWDQDREGLNHHGDWRARQSWKRNPNQLVAYLDFLRQMLHLPSRGYERRPLNHAA